MSRPTTKHDVPHDDRVRLYHELLEHKDGGRLPHRKAQELQQKYGISRQTLSKIWRRGQETRALTGLADFCVQKKGRSGRISTRTLDDSEVAIKNVPPHLRMSLAMLSTTIGIPKTSLWRLLKPRKLKRRTSRIKPMLTEMHKEARAVFARSFLREARNQMHWHDMLDRVHIDEKWFYVTLINRRYYLCHDEPVPVRKCSSKRHIAKVMFLNEVARPRYDSARKLTWDGKIGMWPFVTKAPAQRTSKNRVRGTIVTTPMTVTKPIYRDFLLQHVIPSIKLLWPGRRDKLIYIQQDNARPHVGVDDLAMVAAGGSDGWHFQLVAQPAMSPDFNVLDLGFVNSIQALQHRQVVTGIDDLIVAVHGAFDELDFRVLDKTFMTLQKVMEESLKMDGDNSYKLPHLHKDKLVRRGPVSPRLECDRDLICAIEAMKCRKDFERRVDNLSSVLASCSIDGSINMSNIDQLCTIVDDMSTVADD